MQLRTVAFITIYSGFLVAWKHLNKFQSLCPFLFWLLPGSLPKYRFQIEGVIFGVNNYMNLTIIHKCLRETK